MSHDLPQRGRLRRALRPAALLLVGLVGATTAFTASAAPAQADFPFDVTVAPAGPVLAGEPATFQWSCSPTDADAGDFAYADAFAGDDRIRVDAIGTRRFETTYSGPASQRLLLSCVYTRHGQAVYVDYQVLSAPTAPTITGTSVANGAITVSWDAPSGAGDQELEYELQYRIGDGPFVTAATTPERTTTLSGLANGTTYELRVRATNRAGDGAWSASAFATPQLLAPATTLTFAAVDGGTITAGEPFRATVTVSGSGAVPTGTATIFGISPACTRLVLDADGTASCIVSGPAGTFSFSYDYSGDAIYATADGVGSVEIAPAASTTTLALDSTGPFVVGDDVTLRATVGTDGAFAIDGSVTFTAGDSILCVVSLDEEAQATCTTDELPAGGNDVVATYGGGGDVGASTSAAVRVTVLQEMPELTISAEPAAGVLAGDEVEVTVQVTGTRGDATGTVTFDTAGQLDLDAAAALVCDAVDLDEDGIATCTVTVPAGTTVVTAAYSGDDVYAAAQASVTIEAAKRALDLALATDVASDGTVTATLVAADGAVPTAAAFLVDGVVVPGCEAAPFDEDGVVACTISGIPAGTHEIGARVEDDPIYVDAVATASVTIAAAPAPSPAAPLPGDSANPGAAAPSGPSGTVGLPRTGADAPMWLLGMALLLVAGGAAPFVVRRVRRG
jgi:predicted RNA-binding protein with TRAM domain